jgi:hypothetical protein
MFILPWAAQKAAGGMTISAGIGSAVLSKTIMMKIPR